MDDGGGLENRYAGDCIVGSNPTPSARNTPFHPVVRRNPKLNQLWIAPFVASRCIPRLLNLQRQLIRLNL